MPITEIPTQKGLFRDEFGDDSKTLRSVFRCVSEGLAGQNMQQNVQHGISSVKLNLQGVGDAGFWQLISVRNEIFAIVTDCNFAEAVSSMCLMKD